MRVADAYGLHPLPESPFNKSRGLYSSDRSCFIGLVDNQRRIFAEGLRQLFEKGAARGIRADHVAKVENVLAVLNRARKPSDMDLPGFGLHPLKGNLKDFWSVTVRANWRIIFRFEDGNVIDVDLVDYH